MAFAFDAWSAHDEFVEMIWRARSDRAGTFTSVAASNWELAIMRVNDQTMITARGPETRATKADFPAGATWIGITFKLGAFMPRLPLSALLDRHDVTLPPESSNSFWLHGARWEIPTFENADVFVNRLIRGGMLVRDPVVAAALQGHTPALSLRALQYRFVRATGLTHKTIQQIERARRAVALLEQGTPIAATTFELGYFDQAHLTNALKRFVGTTPAHIAQQRTAV
jgi:hypothetical protein